MNISDPDIRGFLVKYDDGTEGIIACQQAAVEGPFVYFWRMNDQWTRETFVTALNVAMVLMITPVYKDGTPHAERFGHGAADEVTP